MVDPSTIVRQRSLRPLATLRAGGCAERFVTARTVNELATVAIYAQQEQLATTILGGGSNILPSDDGVAGLVIHNLAKELDIRDGIVTAATGIWFQDLFLKTAQAGLGGLQYAVGIPGSLGGALVSNAGAYRSNISDVIEEIEVVLQGVRQWVPAAFMEFGYRDSLLRRPNPPTCCVLQVRMRLPHQSATQIYQDARDYQCQRISKQPPGASAGSFFKNIYDQGLADRLVNLPSRLREGGVVPAGYLVESCGLKGFRYGGAMIGARHANFLLNVGGATATELRQTADIACARVKSEFGITLEEEVLYLGDWSRYQPLSDFTL